ncbi:MAG: dTDP-4-dehydrorhamnose reductase [Chloroflexi bacterium RBG_16_52_11]|nr:MAG: dTDP-4-dehydrorhamnose reductase [Chloroflexi bacterium RBG_16_52_11]
MRSILLLGKLGQLGWELQRALAPLGEVSAFDFPEIDLANEGQVRAIVRSQRPQVIVNATAYTAVDKAESEPEIAMAINARAPGILAEEALRLGAAVIHYSTDYVFDGTKGSQYLENDIPNPLGVYGRSKLGGERAIQTVGGNYLILRTSWVYSLRRDSFVTKVLQWSRQRAVLRIVSDQIGNPTWSRMLAEATSILLVKGGEGWLDWLKEKRGLYHLAGSGYASRLEWAQAILKEDPRREEQVTREIQPALTADFPTPAQRPLFSALNCDLFTRTFGARLPDWQYGLQMAMEIT